ncbi:hypothetical protein IX321_001314 [Bacteroides pyogenes]|nr:hypothetical protein [Bacteroides pyogenes]MBR8717902.1 hypothetical protein [Bacteroides pyogenes]MBR8747041.1 hypothetical protein [Bacteroides pyogenes]MBR8757163.1 hypothetical protein [Bacteroides pyogenes]MBR8780389.1 hypothetical protein [Bacteroides pyogenes]
MNKNLYYLFVNRLSIERLIGRILQYTCCREFERRNPDRYIYFSKIYNPIGKPDKYQHTNKRVHTNNIHNEYLHVYFNSEP